MRRALVVGVVVVGLAAGAAIFVGSGQLRGSAAGPAASPLPAVPSTTEVVAEGRAVPRHGVEVSAAVGGVVAEIDARPGGAVAAGAVLLRLDAAAADAAVESAQATLDAAASRVSQANAAVLQASAEVDAATAAVRAAQATRDQLPGGASTARKRAANAGVDQARAALDAARAAKSGAAAAAAASEADRRAAAAGLAAAASNRGHLVLTAPIGGTVVSVAPEVGDLVSPGLPLVRIAGDGGWLFKTTEVDEATVPGLAVGAAATVILDAFPGTQVVGRVAEISAYGEERQGDILFTVVVEPTGPVPDGVRWNMKATITIATGR